MIIIGTGRIGGMLIERAASRDVPVSVVTRESGWSAIVERMNPIFVTVRTTDLPTVMARIPATRIPDVILCQNGMLTPWLHEQNWSQVTRGVLYMAVPKRGAPVQLADPSPFSGPQAKAVVDWFSALDLPVTESTSDRFQQIEVEKLLWNCVFGLLCHVSQKVSGNAMCVGGFCHRIHDRRIASCRSCWSGRSPRCGCCLTGHVGLQRYNTRLCRACFGLGIPKWMVRTRSLLTWALNAHA